MEHGILRTGITAFVIAFVLSTAAQAAVVSVAGVPTGALASGAEFDVQVRVTTAGAEAIDGYDIFLQFTSASLEFVSYGQGDAGWSLPVGTATELAGTLRRQAMVGFREESVSGELTVGTARLRATADIAAGGAAVSAAARDAIFSGLQEVSATFASARAAVADTAPFCSGASCGDAKVDRTEMLRIIRAFVRAENGFNDRTEMLRSIRIFVQGGCYTFNDSGAAVPAPCP